jgi:hypothetical protein
MEYLKERIDLAASCEKMLSNQVRVFRDIQEDSWWAEMLLQLFLEP